MLDGVKFCNCRISFEEAVSSRVSKTIYLVEGISTAPALSKAKLCTARVEGLRFCNSGISVEHHRKRTLVGGIQPTLPFLVPEPVHGLLR